MPGSVLRELREVLKEARQPPGRDAVANFDAVSALYPAGGENAVRRFEREETSPAYENVDAMVAAYAGATGVSAFDLWDAAIDRAKKARPADVLATELVRAPGSIEEDAEEAAQAAELAAQETAPQRGKSGGSRSPKTRKRRAG